MGTALYHITESTMMKNSVLSLLIVALVASMCNAFSPAAGFSRSETALSAFEGKKLDISRNAYARGGKASWEFELDTMYVEEPKPKEKKVVKKAAKKPAKKNGAKAEKFTIAGLFNKNK